MPVHKVKGGYKYGTKGKVYKSKTKAGRQGRAIKAVQNRQKPMQTFCVLKEIKNKNDS